MPGRLILYDTCNFRDYPVGGQVTSIKNFLKYVGDNFPNHTKDILLVGVSTDKADIGKVIPITVNCTTFNFIGVSIAAINQSVVKKSLRLEYVKGLFKYRKVLHISKDDCNYIHTPEAFGVIRHCCKKATCFVFSHGTYFNMWRRVRFFRKMPVIRKAFQSYLIHIIKNCNGIFVLENDTKQDYSPYNQNVFHVGNSIICEDYFERNIDESLIKFIYAGRLAVVKNIGPIIEAVKSYSRKVEFWILGAGEEYEKLKNIADERIHFVGAVTSDQVKEYMRKTDVLIMNSTFEGIPMTILEAISLGLPVITTDVGGIKEVLDYGKDSEVTDGTVVSIQKAMDKILSNYGRYSLNAYKHSLQFDYHMVNQKIFIVINSQLKW
ncbi:MAG TPA: hypothetical protein DDW65_25585 [Firmicutes bacterium]|nr:hypothetical protein [Bacillota bacterium]